MIDNERKFMVAPCGIDCGICEVSTCKEDPQLLAHLVSRGIPGEKLPCGGCRNVKGHCPVIGDQCATYQCVTARGLDFCYDCGEFPCTKLHPSSDRADVLPHNTKVFNLCTIRRAGVEGFIGLSSEIKRRYYKGKMEIGEGPKIDT
ncbi:MAG TPA: DUF3795 domain-containing protein [Syntrophorhabdaceae bacterium]|nr:DUF3795 domain-containing protein [Syntrophorhabdaceae bacterium]